MNDDTFLTTEEVTAWIKISRKTLWDLVKKKAIPSYKLGKARNSPIRFKRSDIEKWLEEGKR